MNSLQHYIIIGLCIVFFIIGSFGNIISIIIFKKKEFIKQPTTVYLIVSNYINIITVLYLPFMVMPEIRQLINGTIGCQLFGGFTIILSELQSWVYSICSLDRCITTLAPLKFSFKNKLKFQLTLIFICVIILILLCIPFLYYYREYQLDYDANKTVCLFPQSLELNWVNTYFKYQFGLFRTVLPFLITITASFITLYNLCSSKLKLNNHDWKKMQKEFHFARTLITMDILFVLFRIPNTVYASLQSSLIYSYDFLFSVFVFLGVLHNVFIFLIFILFNKIYLELFKILIFRKKRKVTQRSEY